MKRPAILVVDLAGGPSFIVYHDTVPMVGDELEILGGTCEWTRLSDYREDERCFNGNHPRGLDGVCEVDGGRS